MYNRSGYVYDFSEFRFCLIRVLFRSMGTENKMGHIYTVIVFCQRTDYFHAITAGHILRSGISISNDGIYCIRLKILKCIFLQAAAASIA